MTPSARPRVVFAGTPEFAATALAAIHAAGFPIPLVLTQPDRAAGRGLKPQASAVKRFAEAHHIEVLQPAGLRAADKDGMPNPDAQAARARLHSLCIRTDPAQTDPARLGADVMVVAAYGLILPPDVLAMPVHGCINIHASLLPRWRGAAPIHRAIEAGDAETGITLMQMDAGLDTGAMLMREALPIPTDATTASLHDALAALGARMIVDALRRLPGFAPQAQPSVGVSYAAKIDKREAAIDFSQDAEQVARRIRAFNPAPGAVAWRRGEAIKCWMAQAVEASGPPGTVLAADVAGLCVACGRGAVLITQLQRAGGKRLAAREFLAGHPIAVADRFDAEAP